MECLVFISFILSKMGC